MAGITLANGCTQRIFLVDKINCIAMVETFDADGKSFGYTEPVHIVDLAEIMEPHMDDIETKCFESIKKNNK